MNFILDFLSNFFSNILSANVLPSWKISLLFVLTLIVFVIFPKIKKLIKYLYKKIKPYRRSCGNCVLLMFGISEKYKAAEESIHRNVLRKKMIYVEQKLEFVVLELLRNYREFQTEELKEKRGYYENTDKEFWGYKHSLTNATSLLKQEIKRSFLENSFHQLTDRDFAFYVKEKTQTLITIYKKFITTDYLPDMIVNIDDYLNNIFNKDWFEDIVFEIFINAKTIQVESEEQIKILEKQLKDDIDTFVKEKK